MRESDLSDNSTTNDAQDVGNLVQSRAIRGGVHFHSPAVQPPPGATGPTATTHLILIVILTGGLMAAVGIILFGGTGKPSEPATPPAASSTPTRTGTPMNQLQIIMPSDGATVARCALVSGTVPGDLGPGREIVLLIRSPGGRFHPRAITRERHGQWSVIPSPTIGARADSGQPFELWAVPGPAHAIRGLLAGAPPDGYVLDQLRQLDLDLDKAAVAHVVRDDADRPC